MANARSNLHSRRAGSGPETREPRGEIPQRLRALRDKSVRDDARRLIVATLRIRMAQDHWLGRFSAAHPEVRIEALHWTGIDRRTSVLDYWIGGLPAGIWAREITSHSDVERVEALAETANGCLYRVIQRTNPVVGIYRRLGLPLRFPLRIHAGVITWEIVAKRADFDKVLAFLRRRPLDITITSIRRGFLRSHLPVLKPAQQELLAEALRCGYFAVPRRITLTELARRLGRSKSAVSVSLAVIERRMLENASQPVLLAP